MIDSELSNLCAPIVAIGFRAENDEQGKFRFEFVAKDTGLNIVYRDYNWIIGDSVYGSADYASLRDLIENESYRWEE